MRKTEPFKHIKGKKSETRMDIAELICQRAQEQHRRDIDEAKLTFFLCPNNKYQYQMMFCLLPDGAIDFGGTLFKFSKTNVFLIANEALKRQYDLTQQNVSYLFLVVCNKNGELFRVRFPKRIVPCIKQKDMMAYDGDLGAVENINKVFEWLWKFVSRFDKNKNKKETEKEWEQ